MRRLVQTRTVALLKGLMSCQEEAALDGEGFQARQVVPQMSQACHVAVTWVGLLLGH